MRSAIMLLTGAALAALVLAYGLRADDKPPQRTDPKDTAKLEPKDAAPTAITEIEGKDLKRWVDEMRFNEDPSVREKAIRALMLFGPQASPYVQYVVERCTDFESSPRVRAVIALTFMDIQDKDKRKVVDALAKRLDGHMDTATGRMVFDDPQGIVRYHAALALNRFGHEDAHSAVPQLVNATRDWTNFETRRAGVVALRTIARDPKKGPDPRATEALIWLLQTPESMPNEKASEVKLEAIISLAAMGRPEDAKLMTRIEQTLKAYLNHRDPRLSIWAHYSQLALLEPNAKEYDTHLDAIGRYEKSADVVARIHCVTAIGQCGNKIKTHVNVLIRLLQDKDNEVFVAACQALVNLGDPGPDALKALKAVAESTDEKLDAARKGFAKATLDGLELNRKNKDKVDAKDKDKDGKKDK